MFRAYFPGLNKNWWVILLLFRNILRKLNYSMLNPKFSFGKALVIQSNEPSGLRCLKMYIKLRDKLIVPLILLGLVVSTGVDSRFVSADPIKRESQL